MSITLIPTLDGETIGDTAWTNVTYENSWVDFSGTYATVSYRRDGTGRVFLRGLCKNGSSITATIFTLPSGYRPAYQERGILNSNSAAAFWQITTAGVVNVYSGGSTAFVSLNNISFSTT